MSFQKLAAPFIVIACLALAGTVRAQTPPSMEKDPLGYLHYLQTSTDPQAVAVRTQIENGPADLAKAREAAVKDGLTLDAASLQKPLPPEGQNAAPVYAKLAQALKDKPLGLPLYAQPLTASHTYTPEQRAAVQKIYDSRPEVWALVHQAADAPRCVIARDWTKGPALLFPELATFREAERLLYTETYLLAAPGKYSEAVKNQARGFRIAAHAASEPTLMAYLVGEACEAIALRGTQDILNLSGPNSEVAAQITQTVAANRPALSLRYALAGELVMQQITLRGMRGPAPHGQTDLISVFSLLGDSGNPPKDVGKASAADRQFASNLLDASEAVILAQMQARIAAADLPLAARRQALARPPVSETPVNVVLLLPKIMLSFFPMADQPARIEAREAVLLAGAAVMGAWTNDGTFPAALPGAFPDPFTGKPLGYRRDGDGFVVYSVGPDGKFDGGRSGEKTPPGAIVFRHPLTTTPAMP